MVLSNNSISKCIRRILLSRIRLLADKPFYGMLLMYLRVFLTEDGEEDKNVWVQDGNRLCFEPFFLLDARDRELDEAIMSALEEFVEMVIKNEVESSEEDDESEELDEEKDGEGNDSGDKSGEDSDEESDEGDSGDCSEDGPGKNSKGKNQGKQDSVKQSEESKSDDSSNGNQTNEKADDKNDEKSKNNNLKKYVRDEWLYRIKKSYETSQKMNRGQGNCPALADRYFKELQNPQIDWRTILDDFIQEEVVDYSFMPPDYRMEDSDFFLPGFNDKDITVQNILFMIDASGSMSDEDITAAYSEVKGALDQFNGKLEGLLGFFDADVYDPIPFVDESELLKIRPHGGGGTRFDIIFDYVRANMSDDLPSSIVILTDGDAIYPEEKEAMDIPVLWVINNEYNNPPWGKVAKIK